MPSTAVVGTQKKKERGIPKHKFYICIEFLIPNNLQILYEI